MNKIQEQQVDGKNVLIRIDADVDIENGQVVDDTRIEASVPTLKLLLENGAKVTVIGHIGRPDGREVPELKIRPVEDKLIELLGTHTNWQILENLRFNSGEEDNDPEFAKMLVTGQDMFVQDAFATCHRAHASTVGVAELLPSYAGLSVQREIEGLDEILKSPKEGFTIIIGGKKAEDKLPVIEFLFDKAENFLVGGVVADTFLASRGYDLEKSLVENDVFKKCAEIINKFKNDPAKKLLLPSDLTISESLEKPEEVENIGIDEKMPENFMVVDIGRETMAKFVAVIKNSKTIFWNGNMGVTEVDAFEKGSMAVAEAISNTNAKKYAGGGDTSAFIRAMGIAQDFTFISNAGGASLEYLAGEKLPGLEALE